MGGGGGAGVNLRIRVTEVCGWKVGKKSDSYKG